MHSAGAMPLPHCARHYTMATIAGCLWFSAAFAQDDAPDLLLNCQLAGVKRVSFFSPSHATLFDQGNGHPAQLRNDAVTTE